MRICLILTCLTLKQFLRYFVTKAPQDQASSHIASDLRQLLFVNPASFAYKPVWPFLYSISNDALLVVQLFLVVH